jgi:hypothetical protein
VKPNNAAQRCAAILIGKSLRRIAADERAMRRVHMAGIGVLGFIPLSPTYLIAK